MTLVMFMEMISGPAIEASQMAAPVIPHPAMAPAPPQNSADVHHVFFAAVPSDDEDERGFR